MPYDAIEEWVLSNAEYGHLEDIPDWILEKLVCDTKESSKFAWQLFTVYSPAHVVEATVNVRQWLIVERLRRLGKIVFDDTLLNVLPRMNPQGLSTPDGKPFTGSIVEVSPGVVSIVGEEIKL